MMTFPCSVQPCMAHQPAPCPLWRAAGPPIGGLDRGPGSLATSIFEPKHHAGTAHLRRRGPLRDAAEATCPNHGLRRSGCPSRPSRTSTSHARTLWNPPNRVAALDRSRDFASSTSGDAPTTFTSGRRRTGRRGGRLSCMMGPRMRTATCTWGTRSTRSSRT